MGGSPDARLTPAPGGPYRYIIPSDLVAASAGIRDVQGCRPLGGRASIRESESASRARAVAADRSSRSRACRRSHRHAHLARGEWHQTLVEERAAPHRDRKPPARERVASLRRTTSTAHRTHSGRRAALINEHVARADVPVAARSSSEMVRMSARWRSSQAPRHR